eukprot:scaffold5292_cov113-Isochrysis_galbana.AAC.11
MLRYALRYALRCALHTACARSKPEAALEQLGDRRLHFALRTTHDDIDRAGYGRGCFCLVLSVPTRVDARNPEDMEVGALCSLITWRSERSTLY